MAQQQPVVFFGNVGRLEIYEDGDDYIVDNAIDNTILCSKCIRQQASGRFIHINF